jgi:hypothetical protein
MTAVIFSAMEMPIRIHAAAKETAGFQMGRELIQNAAAMMLEKTLSRLPEMEEAAVITMVCWLMMRKAVLFFVRMEDYMTAATRSA